LVIKWNQESSGGQDMKRNSRIVWLDYAKVVGMFLVILGHMYKFSSPPCYVRNFIYLFHMPLFFFISGMFFLPRGLNKMIRSLIIPAVGWIAVWIVFLSLVERLNPLWVLIDTVIKFCNGDDLPCGPAWFLFALFWCQILTLLVIDKRLRWFGGCLVLISWIGMKCLPYCYYGNAAMAMPFFLMGYYGKSWVYQLPKQYEVLLVVVTSIMLFTAAGYFGPASMRSMGFGNIWRCPIHRPFNIALYYLFGLCGIIALLLFFKIINPRRCIFVERCSTGLIVILCFHRFVRVTVLEQYLLDKISSYTVVGFGIRFLAACVLMFVCYCVYRIICRFNCLLFLTGFRREILR